MQYDPPVSADQRASSVRRQHFRHMRALLADAPRRQRLLFLASLVALAVVVALGALARLLVVLPLDLWFTRELQEHPLAFLTALMRFVSVFGYTPWAEITVATAALIVGLALGWRSGAYLVALVVAQGLANYGIKLAISRPRPPSSLVDVLVPVGGNSFPSGHVMFYTVCFGFLFFLAWAYMPRSALRWAALAACAAPVLLVGSSRIILGAHWLSDVLAAYLLGAIILAFGIELYVKYVRRLSPIAHE